MTKTVCTQAPAAHFSDLVLLHLNHPWILAWVLKKRACWRGLVPSRYCTWAPCLGTKSEHYLNLLRYNGSSCKRTPLGVKKVSVTGAGHQKCKRLRDWSLFITWGGGDLGLNKVKFSQTPLWMLLQWSDPPYLHLMTFTTDPPPPHHVFIFQANSSGPPSKSFQSFQWSSLLGF